MIGCRPLGVLVAVLFALTLSTTLQAQQTVSSRYRVLIPDFQPINEEDDDFGKDLADELRDKIDEMLTHSAVDEDDIKDALKQFDRDMEDLNCILARQLAQQANYQVVLCARYSGNEDAWQIQNIRFVDSATGEVFDVDPVVSAKDMEEEAAVEIVRSFELFVEQTRVAIFCGDYAASQQWESSLENCDRALELNPNANTSRYTRASVLRQLDRFPESLEEIDRLLLQDPYHENAMLLGGYLAINLEQQDRARSYYGRYLELDPTNASVRMTVAYDLAQEGDPIGGVAIIEAGVAVDPENLDFYEQLGNFAFAGAEQVRRTAIEAAGGGDGVTPAVSELYGKAIAAYERVFLEKGPEMLVSQLRNVAAAHVQLESYADAIEFAERAIESHPEEASLRAIYAEALKQSGRTDDAIAALAAIEEINPDWPNLYLRLGSWMIEVSLVEEAVPVLQKAVASGSSPDQAGTMIFNHAYVSYVQPTEKNWLRFNTLIVLAKDFEVSQNLREQFEFYHAYSVFNNAIALQLEETPETANRTLPMFQQAVALFQLGKGHADRTAGLEFQQYMENATLYIEIQEAIIEQANRQ
ncbi:MAG TPA: tetratricopeptide repeat protein [Gemmatimonadetes bacterium]|nr:tetratricopeptide repeat protein [Gemmatimonadota bacterium]